MATKAQIQALINAQLASGQAGGISAIQHRDVLKDDTDSILEAVYGSIVQETEVAPTITGSNVNFDYNITINKVGREVSINGNFRCLTTSISSEIFSIANTEYLPLVGVTQEGRAISQAGNGIRVFLLDNSFRTGNSTFDGELYFFSIIYPVKD